MTLPEKTQLLSRTIEHIDITRINVVPLVESMGRMSFSARDLSRAAEIYDRMLRDNGCGIILCLAGSLVSAGLKKVFAEMIRCRMVDAIVSNGGLRSRACTRKAATACGEAIVCVRRPFGYRLLPFCTTRPSSTGESGSCTSWFGHWSPDPSGLCDRRRRGEKRVQSLLFPTTRPFSTCETLVLHKLVRAVVRRPSPNEEPSCHRWQPET